MLSTVGSAASKSFAEFAHGAAKVFLESAQDYSVVWFLFCEC